MEAERIIAEARAQVAAMREEASRGDAVSDRSAQLDRDLAQATAEGIHKIAAAINDRGGADAVNLRIAEQYVDQLLDGAGDAPVEKRSGAPAGKA